MTTMAIKKKKTFILKFIRGTETISLNTQGFRQIKFTIAAINHDHSEVTTLERKQL
jgi:hypothetical protein